jgi:hypothetical protein
MSVFKAPFSRFFSHSLSLSLSLFLTRIAASYPEGLESGWRMLVKLVSFFFFKYNFCFKKINKPIVLPLLGIIDHIFFNKY